MPIDVAKIKIESLISLDPPNQYLSVSCYVVMSTTHGGTTCCFK